MSRIINATGAWTLLGASTVDASVIAAVVEVLSRPVLIADLQAKAAQVAVSTFSVEGAHITASAASAVVAAVAACMTIGQQGGVARLPERGGLPYRVVMQKGHSCNFGAPIAQMPTIAGAQVIEVGSVNRCSAEEVAAQLDMNTAAILHVVSYETALEGMLTLPEVVAIARRASIPVIVDMAGQTELAHLIAHDADLYTVSVQKALRGLTAGLLMGRSDLIAEARRHDAGICRPMKVGKEGIAGAIAAIERWSEGENDIRAGWEAVVSQLCDRLKGIPNLTADRFTYSEDIRGSLCRVFAPSLRQFPSLVDRLTRATIPIFARPDYHRDPRTILLHPMNIFPDDINIIVEALKNIVGSAGTD